MQQPGQLGFWSSCHSVNDCATLTASNWENEVGFSLHASPGVIVTGWGFVSGAPLQLMRAEDAWWYVNTNMSFAVGTDDVRYGINGQYWSDEGFIALYDPSIQWSTLEFVWQGETTTLAPLAAESFTATPEPSTLLLVITGLLILWRAYVRRSATGQT